MKRFGVTPSHHFTLSLYFFPHNNEGSVCFLLCLFLHLFVSRYFKLFNRNNVNTTTICCLFIFINFFYKKGTTVEILQSTYIGGKASLATASTLDSNNNVYITGYKNIFSITFFSPHII